MEIIYAICVYFGYYRQSNIINHLEKYRRLIEEYNSYNFEFVINLMIDSDNIDERYLIAKSVKESFQYPVTVLHNYNSGGTILGLYDTYEYLKGKKLHNNYIIYFEEDFYYTNLLFLNKSLQLIKEYDYVGEVTMNTPGIKIRIHNDINQVWTDGGYYMSNYTKLDAIFKKVGCFHKGDTKTKYDHQIDGIDLGEVGFPTLIYNAGFKFIGIPRIDYFIHNE